MVQLGLEHKVCVASGVIPYDDGKIPNYRNLIDFCALLGIDLKKIEDRQIPPGLPHGKGVLIAPWDYKKSGAHHCVRFCGYVSEQKFQVMDPAMTKAESEDWDEKWISEWSCDVFTICLVR